VKELTGQLDASGLRFALVISRFNEFITSKLLDGALDFLRRNGAEEEKISCIWVPGSFEIPLAAKRLASSDDYDALICLGAVIRGDTAHFEYVANEVTKGIAKVTLDTELPVGYGIITPDTLEQAIERAGTKAGNKGWDAAQTAVEMANLMRVLE